MSPFIFTSSMEKAAPFNVVSTHDVVSREIILWKSFDLLLGSNLSPYQMPCLEVKTTKAIKRMRELSR